MKKNYLSKNEKILIGRFPSISNFIRCIGLKDNESVLILTDNIAEQKPIKLIADALALRCSNICVKNLPVTLKPDFPDDIRNKVIEFDVIILLPSQSWYQSPTRSMAKHKYKKRVIECYGLTEDMLKDGGLCADYKKVELFTKEFKYFFSKGSQLSIKSHGGSNFSARIENVFEETGFYRTAGTGGNLPAGEISLGIADNSLCGEIVFDISFDMLGRLDKDHLKIHVNKDRVIKISGKHRTTLEYLIEQDNRLSHIAEIGIGTNPYSIIGRSVLEDEKKLGTVHIGFGNDTYFGGTTDGAHLDGVFVGATIIVDKKLIMKNGKLIGSVASETY